jgi:VWFA-related protein
MIARRREKLALDALDDLVLWLRGVREERKAVLAVSDGWRLFRPNRALANTGNRNAPQPGIGAGPSGRVTTDVARDRYGSRRDRCEMDRLALSELDHDRAFKDLLDRANRSNVSFYPIDSRGLPVFDTPIEKANPGPDGSRAPVSIEADQARLRQRLESLQTLASATDGLAVVNSNDIERGLSRIVADVGTYYLLGYYSTNSKLDGTFRSLRVRVKRPGVDVRARRGYLAATEEEVRAGTPAAPVQRTAAEAALDRALAGLAGRADARVRTNIAWLALTSAGQPRGRLWAIAELDRTLARAPEWTAGARIEATLVGKDGTRIDGAKLELPSGQRTVTIELPDVSLPPGELALRLRMVPASGGLPLVETLRFTVPLSSSVGDPRLWRRGPITGPQFVLTGDATFRRNEQLRIELPLAQPAESVKAELLERTGKVMPIPVTARVPDAPTADVSWALGEVVLAPLAAGDYVVRMTIAMGGSVHESLTAFRIVP